MRKTLALLAFCAALFALSLPATADTATAPAVDLEAQEAVAAEAVDCELMAEIGIPESADMAWNSCTNTCTSNQECQFACFPCGGYCSQPISGTLCQNPRWCRCYACP